jgi:hypothetical protein
MTATARGAQVDPCRTSFRSLLLAPGIVLPPLVTSLHMYGAADSTARVPRWQRMGGGLTLGRAASATVPRLPSTRFRGVPRVGLPVAVSFRRTSPWLS